MSIYQPRTYRHAMRPEGLVAFRVVEEESDLMVHARRDLASEAREALRALRAELNAYLAAHPRFGESFSPVPLDATASPLVREMAQAAEAAGVGPMAAVAGAIAEAVARALSDLSPEVIVENGGDVFMIGPVDRVVALWTGPAAPPVGIRLPSGLMPCAVATSSATIGPSMSLGAADAATVVARSGALADAVASRVGNWITGPDDFEPALVAGFAIDGVEGVVASVRGHLAVRGRIELVPLARGIL